METPTPISSEVDKSNPKPQPSSSAISEEKSNSLPRSDKHKVNYWKILLIFLALIILVAIVFIFLGYKENLDNTSQTNTVILSDPEVLEENQDKIQLQTITLQANNIADNTELIFSENNIVYSVKNDGVVKKIAAIEENIIYLQVLPNNNDFFVVSNPDYSNSKHYYFFKEGELIHSRTESLRDRNWLRTSARFHLTRNEWVTTKELEDGQADILVDRLDGSELIKIGHLNNKPLERLTCETGDSCSEGFYPQSFAPSFDGSYLLGVPSPGGGLGEPGLVISRDGSKVYKIDFNWYVGSAAWIENNQLLVGDQNGSKIFTFKSDGTFQTEIIETIGMEGFNQTGLSPDKTTLVMMDYSPTYQILLFDIKSKSKKVVVDIQFNNGADVPNIIGWNNQSNQILYSIRNEVKVYDTQTGTSKTVANLNPPEWVKDNISGFANDIFDIR